MTVTVQSALTEVQDSARRLRDVTRELVLIAVEDQPRNCQVHLVAVVHDAALDVAAEAEQADAAIAREMTAKATAPQVTTAHAVASCQHHVTLLGAALVGQLAAPDVLNDLATMARERDREVSAWVAEVNRCIQASNVSLWTDMQPALLGYWRELADITDRSCMSGD
jgi:hypothetical protein